VHFAEAVQRSEHRFLDGNERIAEGGQLDHAFQFRDVEEGDGNIRGDEEEHNPHQGTGNDRTGHPRRDIVPYGNPVLQKFRDVFCQRSANPERGKLHSEEIDGESKGVYPEPIRPELPAEDDPEDEVGQ